MALPTRTEVETSLAVCIAADPPSARPYSPTHEVSFLRSSDSTFPAMSRSCSTKSHSARFT